jgi:hypothetical protein
MPVVFDTSIIVLMLNQDAKQPKDPKTDAPLEHARQRVDYLVRVLSKGKITDHHPHAGSMRNTHPC